MDNLTLIFAGDLIPPVNTSINIYSEQLLGVLRDKDFSLVNLETPITTSSDKICKTGRNFKVLLKGISAVKNGFFDAVALANNHIRDFGDEGINETFSVLKDNQILSVGAGINNEEASQPLRINIKGTKISLLNYSETEFNIATKLRAGANQFDIIKAYYDIKAEKSLSDYVIVVYHGGLEYCYFPSPEIIQRFKFLTDAGSDAIISHHTHRYSGILVYKEKPIFFGLGNFLANTISKSGVLEWRTGLVVKLKLNHGAVQYELYPILMEENFGSVSLLKNSEKQKILNHINELSEKIEDLTFLESFWKREYPYDVKRTLNIINSRNRLEYRLFKHFPIISNLMWSDYKLLNLLGMIQNDSNRYKLIESLRNLLFERGQ